MEGIPGELIVVGGVIVLAAVAVLVVKFGKALLILLALAGLALAVIIALALLRQPSDGSTLSQVADIARAVAPRAEPEPEPARCYPGAAFMSGILTTLGVEALAGIGYLWLRFKLGDGQHARLERRRPQSHARPMAQAHEAEPPPVVFIVDDGQQAPVDPSQWGW